MGVKNAFFVKLFWEVYQIGHRKALNLMELFTPLVKKEEEKSKNYSLYVCMYILFLPPSPLRMPVKEFVVQIHKDQGAEGGR